MKSVFLSALLFVSALHAATGDVQFGVVGSTGALTSSLVTPGTPPAVFGIAPGGALTSFTLGAGLTLSSGTISAGGGAWGDITGSLAAQTDLSTALLAKLDATLAASTYQPLIGTGTLPLSKLATDPLARANHTGTQAWSTLSATPTTLSGYGITDAITAVLAASTYATRASPALTGSITLTTTAVPGANPPAGCVILYVDPADNTLRARGSNGTITILANP